MPLVKTGCISHDAYAIFQALRRSKLVVVCSIKLNKEARISLSVNCKKGTLLWLGDEWQQWHVATGSITITTVSRVPENYLWAKWIMKFVIKTCQLRQIWLFRLKNIAFHIVMAFPDDQVEEFFFWIWGLRRLSLSLLRLSMTSEWRHCHILWLFRPILHKRFEVP